MEGHLLLAHLASLLLLAFAVSLDGFGVGVTYGLRRIRIPLLSIAIISLCSGFIVWLAMQVGALLSRFMSADIGSWVGAALLILIGMWALVQYWRGRQRRPEDEGQEPPPAAMQAEEQEKEPDTNAIVSFSFELRSFGLVIQILRKPQIADVDRSGIITASEALLLGFALSLDSFGAGFGAAMVGYTPLPTALLISIASGLFLLAGMKLGFRFSTFRVMQSLSILPGMMLIVMGILKLF
ncbi:sporulation membrane protein YtaF [Paenibacillus sp. GCM10027626]|uniref:sporulation membrane protein YtaF n=1 Tax=Paenibacillus sp. GCM10027626 TaxID=3273411 RepID=UPI003632A768